MKIAIFSDIHGNLPALKAILNDIKSYSADEIVCLGDTIAIGPQSGECLDLIIKNNIKMVLGNHELYYLNGTEIDDKMSEEEKVHHEFIKNTLSDSHFQYISNLPLYLKLQCGSRKLLFAHFFIRNVKQQYPFYELNILRENATLTSIIQTLDSDIIFVGHEHNPFEITCSNIKICGTGSSGCSANNLTHYHLIDFNGNDLSIQHKTIQYERNELKNAFESTNYPCKEFIKKTFFGIE